MPLRIRGSAFYFGKAADAPDAGFDSFFTWIVNQGPDVQWPYIAKDRDAGVRRSLYCNLDDTHFVGVFLSARSAEFQHFVKREGTQITIEARSTAGNPPVEMNFFCIRRDSNKGIYSHYVGSFSFQRFLNDLWASYRNFVTQQRDVHLNALAEGETKTRVQKLYALRNRRRDSPLYTPGSFDALLARLDSICEVRATTYSVDAPSERPVSQTLKSVHKTFHLAETPATPSVRDWLRGIRKTTAHTLKSGETKHSGSILGKEASGDDFELSFENSMEDYLQFDYDQLGTFNVASVKTHHIIQAMLAKMDAPLFQPSKD